MQRSVQARAAQHRHPGSAGHRDVLRLALRITRSENGARILFREIFLQLHALQRTSRTDGPCGVQTFRVAAGRCLVFLEQAALRPTASAGSRPPALSALDLLTPHERIVFELKHYHGFRLDALAEILPLTESAIRNTLCRALRKLRFVLSEISNPRNN